MGGQNTEPCAECYEGIPWCRLFRFHLHIFSICKEKNWNLLRYWGKHRNLLGGRCWNLPKKAGQSQIVVHWLWPSPKFEVIAVDADSVNLAYIRKSLEKNALWGSTAVRLINNAVRFVKSWKPFLPAVLSISFRFLAITYLHKSINYKQIKFAVMPEGSSTFSMTFQTQTLEQLKWKKRMSWWR